MKIYVAGKYEEGPGVISYIARVLESRGHIITFKWWEGQEFNKLEKSLFDLEGVKTADALVVYMENSHSYKGTWVEVGYAIAKGKPIYFMGQENADMVFRSHILCRDFYTEFPDKEVIDFIRGYQDKKI